MTAVAALGDLFEGAARPLGDVVLVDCPQVDAQAMAALARLDLRAARSEARLIVSTSVDALDDVFSCMDQSAPVILVNPNRAERVIALSEVLESDSQAFRLGLVQAAQAVIARSLDLVGVEAPERM